MCFFSTFYVIDVNFPIRLETKASFPPKIQKFSLDVVPRILKPSRVKSGFDFQAQSENDIGSYYCLVTNPSIFVFCWEKQ